MKAARNIGKIIFVLLFAVAWNYVFAQPAAMAVISAQGTYMPYEIGQASFYSYE